MLSLPINLVTKKKILGRSIALRSTALRTLRISEMNLTQSMHDGTFESSAAALNPNNGEKILPIFFSDNYSFVYLLTFRVYNRMLRIDL